MSDRIKLAEAMEWTNSHQYRWDGPGDGEYRNDPPDPFTDANDDYAVLEWMRNNWTITQLYESIDWHAVNYKIGDFARAALKMLERVLEEHE